MKKNYIFYACAAAALVFASCQKEGPMNDGIDVSSCDLNVVTATILQTKTTVDGINVLWENGDKIGLRPATGETEGTKEMVEYITALDKSSESATFVKVEGETESTALRGGKYIAIFPSEFIYVNWGGQYERVTLGIKDPNDDSYRQVLPAGGGWDNKSAVMITASEDANFTFKHVMSYIKFTVDSQSPEFDQVVISTNSEQELINRINVNYDGTYALNNLNSYKSSSVVLTTSTGEAFTPGTYYAAVLPQTYTGGFTFSFFNGGDLIGNKSVESDVVFERGDVGNMGVVGSFSSEDLPDPLQVGDVYVEGGVNQGVVFWVDPENPYKGKVVSVSSAEAIKWATDTYTDKVGSTNTTDGLANFDKVTALDVYKENPDNFPAMKFCDDLRTNMGGNWYLPVVSELQTLYNAYYGLSITSWSNGTDYRFVEGSLIDMTSKRTFDAALKILRDDITATLDGDSDNDGISDNAGYGTGNGVQYWVSKVNSNGNAQYVRFGNYTGGNGTKTTAKYVRCIRDVEAK